MALAATVERYRELGFRVIDGGKSGKCAVLKTPAVAEIFGVRHDNVMRDVREYQERLPSDLRAVLSEHCRPSNYVGKDRSGSRDCFELTKVGFNTIAAKYDPTLRFLLALAFDALEHDNAGADVIRQIDQRIRELRSKASGQDELTLEAPKPVVAPSHCEEDAPDYYAEDDDLDDAKARGQWHREAPPHDDRGQGYPAGDCWVNREWHIRRASAGNSLMDLWITTKDAMMPSHDKRWLIPSPNGKSQVRFHFSNPWPPVDVVIHAYESLGPGPYAPVGIATLRHYLAC